MMFEYTLKDQEHPTLTSEINREWNQLPLSLRSLNEIKSFKNQLKTYYFTKAFPELC